MIIETIKKKSIRNEYIILYRSTDEENTLIKNQEKPKYMVIPATSKYWYADPLLFEYNDKIYLFTEAYDRKKEIGRIAVSEYIDGKFTEPVIVIKESFHMSFPFVFLCDDNIYMIPETSSIGEIRIYRAEESVYEWSLYKKFKFDGAVDSIVYRHMNKWLLFTAIVENNPIYTKESILSFEDNINHISELKESSLNYDLMEGLESRNGGKIVAFKNEEYMIKQGAVPPDLYGIYLKIYKFKVANNSIVREEEKEIFADDVVITDYSKPYKKIGIHTYDYVSGIEVVDINLDVSRFINLIRETKRELDKRIRTKNV